MSQKPQADAKMKAAAPADKKKKAPAAKPKQYVAKPKVIVPPKKKDATKPKEKFSKSSKKRKLQQVMRYLKQHPKLLAAERAAGALDHLKPARVTPPKGPKPVHKQKKEGKKIQVPESVLIRKRVRLHTLAKKLASQRREKLKEVFMRQELVHRAQRHLSEYKNAEKEAVRMRRYARMTGNFYREADAKLVLVIRIKGIMGLTPRTRKILKLFRLPQINNASFVRVNKATSNMLRLISPYVAYGYPNLATVRKLLYKRGYCRHHGQRKPIVDNRLIRHHLGKYDIVCMEDLLHEIYTVGPHFKQANHFLWAFKLRNPVGGFVRKSTSYLEGGDNGNREEKINELARRML